MINIAWLSSREAQENKKIDFVAVILMAAIWLAESFISNSLWGTKKTPFVDLT